MKMKPALALLMSGLIIAGASLPAYAQVQPDAPRPEIVQETQQQENEPEPLTIGESGGETVKPDTPMGTPDSKPPVLHSVSIDKTEIEAGVGGTVTMTINATDDVSGISWMQVKFINKKNGRELEGYRSFTQGEPLELKIEISEFEGTGLFELNEISLVDKAENRVYYQAKTEHYTPENIVPVCSFTVKNPVAEKEDITAPVLNQIKIDKTEVTAPGVVTVTIDATDDVSGISWMLVKFINKKNGRELEGYRSFTQGEPLELKIKISEFEGTGLFELNEIVLVDKAGNRVYYHEKTENYTPENIVPVCSFTVKNPVAEKEDITAPVLNQIKIDKTEITAPGAVTVTIDATDDISGLDHSIAEFINKKNGRKLEGYQSFKQGEPLELKIKISEFEETGLFELNGISLVDKAGNRAYYQAKTEHYTPENIVPVCSFLVKNADAAQNGDIVASTNTPNLADKIEKMEGDTAYIYYGNDSTLNQEVFEAIKGTNKKIVLSSGGIQWTFNGKDITDKNIKDIQLNTNMTSKYASDEIYQQIEWGQEAMILNFADNGELPGKATIRIKADYVFQHMEGKDNFYVYYYDNTNKDMVLVAPNLSIIDGEEQYLEFEITHNSSYVITKGPWQKPKDDPFYPVDPDPVDPDPVDPDPVDPDPVDPVTPSKPSKTPSAPSYSGSVSSHEDRDTATSAPVSKKTQIMVNGKPLKSVKGEVTSAQFAKLAKSSKGKAIAFETVSGKKAEAKLSVMKEDMIKSGKSILTKIYVNPKYAANKTAQRKFEKMFPKAELKVITFAQQGDFPVEVTAGIKLTKKELAQFKDGHVYLYNYNPKTNKYKYMGKVPAKLDKAGFLNFVTDRGNTMILSDRLLKK